MALIVKTAGLLFILYTLSLVPDRVGGYLSSTHRSGSLFFAFVLVPIFVPLAIGVFLFSFPAAATGLVAGAAPSASSDLERMLQAVIFAGIGLYIAVRSILDSAYYFVLDLISRDDASFDASDPRTRARLIVSCISVAVGLFLLFGARGLSALVAKVRQ